MIKNNIAFFYMLSNKNKNVLYIGSTNNLIRRIDTHKKKHKRGFTNKYNVDQLVCFELFNDISDARRRERKIKGWKRHRKIELIQKKNISWKDLYEDLKEDPSFHFD